MGRVYFPTSNDIGVRSFSRDRTLGAALWENVPGGPGPVAFLDLNDFRAPAEGAPRAAEYPWTPSPRGNTHKTVNLGAALTQDPLARPTYVLAAPSPFRVVPAPPSGSGAITGPYYLPGQAPASPAPPVAAQTTPTPTVTPVAAPATQAQPTLVTSGGGTAAPSTGTYAGTPIPTNFPTSQAYVDSSGNVWTYNAASGGWSISSYGAAAGSAPVSTAATTTAAAATTSPSLYDQVATWLQGTTPIGSYNMPNALLAAGVGVTVALLMAMGKGKR